jgi:hypothetical protein
MPDDLQLPDQLLNLSKVVEKYPEAFASGSSQIQSAALSATKFIFDLGESSKVLFLLLHHAFGLIVCILKPFSPRRYLYPIFPNYYHH